MRLKCIHTHCSRVPWLCFPFLLAPPDVAALSQWDVGIKGARLRTHLRLNQRLSAVTYLPCVVEIVRWCSSAFVWRPDKTDRKPSWSGSWRVSLRRGKSSLPLSSPLLLIIQKAIFTCCPLIAPNSNIWIILVTVQICRLLSGGVF